MSEADASQGGHDQSEPAEESPAEPAASAPDEVTAPGAPAPPGPAFYEPYEPPPPRPTVPPGPPVGAYDRPPAGGAPAGGGPAAGAPPGPAISVSSGLRDGYGPSDDLREPWYRRLRRLFGGGRAS
jgi:hypothetical protein